MAFGPAYLNTEPSDHEEEYASSAGQGCQHRFNAFYHKWKICMCISAPGSLIDNEWNIKPRPWLVYRFTMAAVVLVIQLYLFSSHMVKFAGTDGAPKFFIFLTNWSFIVLTVAMVTKAYVCWSFRRYLGYVEEVTAPKPFLAVWVLTNISTAAAVGVTVTYWTAVHNYAKTVGFGDVAGHILNSVFVLMDVCLTALPFRWGHFYQTLVYGMIYIFFTLFYWACGGTSLFGSHSIYPILDWDRPGFTVLIDIVGAPIVILLLQVVLSLMSAARMVLAHKLNTPR